MTAIPQDNYVSDNARTEQEVDDWLELVRDGAAEMPGGNAVTTVEIASGTLTPAVQVSWIQVRGEGTLDDVLDFIAQENHPEGRILILIPDPQTEITITHNAVGAGQIFLREGANIVLNDASGALWLVRRGTAWYEMIHGRNDAEANFNQPSDVQEDDFAVGVHSEADGSNGGTATAGSYQVWPGGNGSGGDFVIESSGQVSTTANPGEFVPDAGTWKIDALHQFFKTGNTKVRLYNVTQATAVMQGLSGFEDIDDNGGGFSMLKGFFTANGTDVYRMEYRVANATAGNGLGTSTTDTGAGQEFYGNITLLKVA